MHFYWTSPLQGFTSSARKPPPLLSKEPLFSQWNGTGHFWLPDRADHKLWGRASFRPGDVIEIVLEGNLWPYGSTGRFKCPVIHGTLFNGAPCALFDSSCAVESYWAVERHDRTIVDSRYLLVGQHLPALSEVLLSRLTVQFSHLDDWFHKPYRVTYKPNSDDKALLSFSPDSFEASVLFDSAEFRLSLFCGRTIPHAPTTGKIEWTYRYSVVIESVEPQSFDLFIQVATLVRKILVFLIGTGVYTLSLNAVLWEPDEGPPRTKKLRRLQILTPVAVPMLVRTDPRAFSTRFEQVAAVLPGVFAEWFRRKEELAVVTSSYSEILLIDGAAEETFFLRIAQVLEHFHGLLWPESRRYASRSNWKLFRSWLGENLPDPLPGLGTGENRPPAQLRDLLLNRIGSLNELSFRSRLEELFKRIPGRWLMPILDNPPPGWERYLNSFLASVEATRHYLTHFDPEQSVKALRGEALEVATSRCWSVLSFWLARTVGFSEEIAGRIAMNAKRAMFLIAHRTAV